MTKRESITDKIRRRIRRFLETGLDQPRVYFESTSWGVYKLEHDVVDIPFFVDRRGRIHLYEG